ncbi:MAG: FHA domain-containing protein, partial [Myxococcaceae bacterium]|nr:FHA domain-containing protein [Myxococcaceae bacterium]
MTRAYLLSFLTRQFLLRRAGFETRYPHPWLVWEPGSWRAPPVNAGVAETLLPGAARPPRAGPGDALCFELDPKTSPGPLRIGRAEGSELLISDATVSREHCVLRREGAAWFVKASPSVKSMRVAGRPLAAGAETQLEPGQQLDLGEVKLTFLDGRQL